jgi:hypothetical protein
MIRISCRVEVLLMAPDATCRCAFKLFVNVARAAVECGVHASQGKPCHRRMVELRTKPAVHVVAGFTSHRKATGTVVKHRCLEVPGVTRIAAGRESLKSPNRCSGMAGIALHKRMSAN